MNDYLRTHTWMAHTDVWWCAKFTFLLLLIMGLAALLLWCICVGISSYLTARQERTMRKRRRQGYWDVGKDISFGSNNQRKI